MRIGWRLQAAVPAADELSNRSPGGMRRRRWCVIDRPDRQCAISFGATTCGRSGFGAHSSGPAAKRAGRELQRQRG